MYYTQTTLIILIGVTFNGDLYLDVNSNVKLKVKISSCMVYRIGKRPVQIYGNIIIY